MSKAVEQAQASARRFREAVASFRKERLYSECQIIAAERGRPTNSNTQ